MSATSLEDTNLIKLEANSLNGNTTNAKLINGDSLKSSNGGGGGGVDEAMESDDATPASTEIKQECQMIVESDQEADYDDDDVDDTNANNNGNQEENTNLQNEINNIKQEAKPVLTNGHATHLTNGVVTANDDEEEEDLKVNETDTEMLVDETHTTTTNDLDKTNLKNIKNEPDENNLEEKRKRRVMLKREKALKLKQLQLELKKEEAKLILFKRLYYSQRIVPSQQNNQQSQQRNPNSLQQRQNQLNNSNVNNKNAHIINNNNVKPGIPGNNGNGNQLQNQKALLSNKQKVILITNLIINLF